MHKLGVISILLGLVSIVAGLTVGFALAFSRGTGDEWFSLIPSGFALLLFGVIITQLNKK